MSRHRRLQKTLRSPDRARTVRNREKRQMRLWNEMAETGAPADVAQRVVRVQRLAGLVPGGQLRSIFSREPTK